MVKISSYILALLFLAANGQAADRLPNIVLIFTDDQGFTDVGVFGSEQFGFSTPNIDRMAREGVQFTSFYSASSVCSPSRAGLLTGS